MIPQVRIDATQALARFSPQGIPEAVRNNLRRVLPRLGKDLGAAVEASLLTLRSSQHLEVKKELLENPTQLTARVRLVWTGDASKKLVPHWLEEGTRPHVIRAVNAKALFFFWARMGMHVAFKQVNHPGTRRYAFVRDALKGMAPEIQEALTVAVKEGGKK